MKHFMATLSLNEIRARLASFSERWKDAKDEDADAKSFWDHLFQAYGANRLQVARFEARIKKLDGNPGRIDLLWKGKLVVEHKSRGRDLTKAKEQALDYIERLPPKERPRYVVTCDFARFEVFDLQTGEETKFPLEDIAKNAEALAFIAGYEPKRPTEETPVNIAAVERLGELYDTMRAGNYPDHDLQEFLVRILFCLFAEDTGVFEPDAFTDIILNRTSEDGSDLGVKLNYAFEILNSQLDKRQKALDESLAVLPYVNGALFERRLAMAAMDSKMRAALIRCTEFDWSKISPAIFGSLFQGVMDAAERRAAGAHYTAEDNILKLIKPLFLDELQAEFTAIKSGPKTGREGKLKAFHEKLGRLKFFDPACGCGNFLIITYRELRKLEIEVLKEIHPSGQGVLDVALLSKLNVDQFYGIEIDEFPAQIAKVAMWLMDHVMNVELGYAFGKAYTRLPLTKSANIIHGNALQIPWEDVIKPEECSYILGNPPFIGKSYQTTTQKADFAKVWGQEKSAGVLDFVTCWHKLAAEFTHGTKIPTAFVSTNSITQGEQVSVLWNYLLNRHQIKIHFAHRTFPWASEARGKAHVHVVIIGFAHFDIPTKMLFDYEDLKTPSLRLVRNINPYLIDFRSDLLVTKQSKPICQCPPMLYGSKPVDGGNLILTEEEKQEFVSSCPAAEKFLRPFLGSEELINGNPRWCLWLHNVPPTEWRNLIPVYARVEKVREFRLKSTKAKTREQATTPSIFAELRQPTKNYLGVPEVSSENRRYIPIAYLSENVISSNKLYTVSEPSLYSFGILTSSMHMAWTNTVTGRLKSDYQYSTGLVYNTFPWPNPTLSQKSIIEEAAQAVLDARAQFPNSTLADLYDPNTMPPELVKAHAALDKAVEKAYRPQQFTSYRERVEFLFGLYEKLTAPLAPTQKPKKSRKDP